MKGKLARKAAKNSPSFFINRDQEISGWVQGDAGDVAAMRVWEGARVVTDDVKIIYALARVQIANYLLDEIKNSYSTSNRRKKTGAVRCEEQISAAINCPKQVRKLL